MVYKVLSTASVELVLDSSLGISIYEFLTYIDSATAFLP